MKKQFFQCKWINQFVNFWNWSCFKTKTAKMLLSRYDLCLIFLIDMYFIMFQIDKTWNILIWNNKITYNSFSCNPIFKLHKHTYIIASVFHLIKINSVKYLLVVERRFISCVNYCSFIHFINLRFKIGIFIYERYVIVRMLKMTRIMIHESR